MSDEDVDNEVWDILVGRPHGGITYYMSLNEEKVMQALPPPRVVDSAFASEIQEGPDVAAAVGRLVQPRNDICQTHIVNFYHNIPENHPDFVQLATSLQREIEMRAVSIRLDRYRIRCSTAVSTPTRTITPNPPPAPQAAEEPRTAKRDGKRDGKQRFDRVRADEDEDDGWDHRRPDDGPRRRVRWPDDDEPRAPLRAESRVPSNYAVLG